MMKVIGHRGASGYVTENTLGAIQKAVELGVHAIEIDVQITKDRHLVAHHDANLLRICGVDKNIDTLTLQEVRAIRGTDGERIATLKEALESSRDMTVFLEVKNNNVAAEVAASLDAYPRADIRVTSFHHHMLHQLLAAYPHAQVYTATRTKPLDIIHTAAGMHAKGVSMNAWLLNPFTYWLAKRKNLEIMVYTINSPLLARFIHTFYKGIWICSDYPDKLMAILKDKSS